jgi:cytochrome c oxidase subunit 1
MSLPLEAAPVPKEAPLIDPRALPWRRWTVAWMLTVFALFAVLVLLGLVMRLVQANVWASLPPEWFYAVLTLHGLGMVGAWYVGAMAAVSYRLASHARPSLAVAKIAFGGTLLGVVLLIAATLVGRFGTGWYFLHPLPFYSSGTWPQWAVGAFFLALGVLGVTWTVWTIDLLRAIARRWSLGGALAWPTLLGRSGREETPGFILVVTSSLISALAAFAAAVVVLALYLVEWLGTDVVNDSLLMKNLIFFFGHGLVNITMYLGVALVYDLMPGYTGRTLKVNRLVAAAWNLAIFLVLAVYFHHLYMDFAQPTVLQYVGQIGSYLISIPAAVISVFSVLYLVYRAQVRWTLTSMFLFFGVMGWAIGGVEAIIDSTIAANVRFHNTLWVPSHFHTYYLLGVVLMILAFAHHLGGELSGLPERPALTRAITLLFLAGGYGLVLMFALAGAHSVPRRYAAYPAEVAQGITYAQVSLIFGTLLLAGVGLYVWDTARRCWKGLSA